MSGDQNAVAGPQLANRWLALELQAGRAGNEYDPLVAILVAPLARWRRVTFVQLREACQRHDLRDHIVAVEMTGTYHRPVQRAFRKAGSETRLVHPFASRHYRQPASPDIKTDDTDLEAIFRAAVNGFGLLEPVPEEVYQRLQLLARHRRDLVENVANRAARTVFQMVSGRRLYHHPSRLDRQYVLDKLFAFHHEHGTPPHEILRDLQAAAEQMPKHEHAAEAVPLQSRCDKLRRSRRRGPQEIGTILVAVLARLGVAQLESTPEAQGPIATDSDTST